MDELATKSKGKLQLNEDWLSVLIAYGSPELILKKADGSVWKWLAPISDLAEIKKKHLLSGSIRHGDQTQVRVLANQRPNEQAEPVAPTLEDAYLACLKGMAQ